MRAGFAARSARPAAVSPRALATPPGNTGGWTPRSCATGAWSGTDRALRPTQKRISRTTARARGLSGRLDRSRLRAIGWASSSARDSRRFWCPTSASRKKPASDRIAEGGKPSAASPAYRVLEPGVRCPHGAPAERPAGLERTIDAIRAAESRITRNLRQVDAERTPRTAMSGNSAETRTSMPCEQFGHADHRCVSV